jgi:EAL domain-containing protein (putative c-di-GMP-specific phosphodiesterase class I)
VSPQEAAKHLREFRKEIWSNDYHAAFTLSIAALEREAKAEPVAWRVWNAEDDQWIYTEQYQAVQNSAHAQPLYASPPAPETPSEDRAPEMQDNPGSASQVRHNAENDLPVSQVTIMPATQPKSK